jgi:ferrous iron transport protein B
MYLVFFLTFRLGSYPMTWIEHGVEWLGSTVVNTWPADWAPDLRSLVVDGIIGGVGGVIVFLPNILLLFLAIAFLEGTGYMARAAFIMDQLMHKIGLHGKSFIPMLIGFGCSVPAILATRTLENRRDRLTTMLVLPLMSCGARLTIYALFIPAFFPPAWQAPVLWIIYFTGILLAVGAAKLLRVTVLRGETVPFVMELPPYRMPPLHGVLVHMWERAWEYLRKAGTVILALSVVLWALTSYPKPDATETAVDDGAARLEKTYEAGLADVAAMIYAPTETIPHEPLMSPEQSTLEEPWPVLVSVIDNVSAARSDYEQALEGLHEDNTARKAELRLQRDAILSGIREQNPQLYTVALHYIDDVYEPYHAAKERLEARQEAARLQYSIAGRIGRGLEPVLRPLGFDWRIGTALIGAMAAKEVFVAQMGIVFSLGEEGGTEVLRQKLREHYTPLVGFCVMLFCLISTPCVATIAATRQESGSWKWALFQLIGLTVLAYAVTMLVYQGGAFFGWGT